MTEHSAAAKACFLAYHSDSKGFDAPTAFDGLSDADKARWHAAAHWNADAISRAVAAATDEPDDPGVATHKPVPGAKPIGGK